MEYRPKPQQPSVVQPISAASPEPLLDATHTTKPATDIPSTSEPAVMESHPTSVETHGILEDDVDIPTTVLTCVTHPDTADNALVSQEVPSQALVVQEIGFAPVTVMETVRLSLGFDDAVSSNNCKIWAFWRGGVSVSVEENNLQFLHLKITTLASGAASFVTAVYAKCTRRERQQLWTDLCSLQTSVAMAPWLVGGDLNTIASPDEYCGN